MEKNPNPLEVEKVNEKELLNMILLNTAFASNVCMYNVHINFLHLKDQKISKKSTTNRFET